MLVFRPQLSPRGIGFTAGGVAVIRPACSCRSTRHCSVSLLPALSPPRHVGCSRRLSGAHPRHHPARTRPRTTAQRRATWGGWGGVAQEGRRGVHGCAAASQRDCGLRRRGKLWEFPDFVFESAALLKGCPAPPVVATIAQPSAASRTTHAPRCATSLCQLTVSLSSPPPFHLHTSTHPHIQLPRESHRVVWWVWCSPRRCWMAEPCTRPHFLSST